MKYCYIYILLFLSCKSPARIENCDKNIKNLLKKNSDRLEVNDSFSNGAISMMVDKKTSSVFGAYYFYPSGELKSYKFFMSPPTYVYNEEFDSLGNQFKTEGKSLMAHLFRKADSQNVEFTFLFFSLNKNYRNIHIRSSIGSNQSFEEIQPYKLLTNVHFLTFQLPVVKSFNKLSLFTTYEVENKCSGTYQVFIDTAVFQNFQL
ncbi:hypothetical protein [Ferruginibacter sp. HRS2-29]|uniref:hypothetical protein n=1 Tax=Ferruginibacter sp. HRS2-29 TaxID=2487334 RepID=UPI0020CC7306|nr:hypothetical protein [Ferruginibacter sp. HRS2-29]MCP9750048.1 hypothetical protein [Ferruginibacter sp. HRS2-29]